MVSTIPTHAVHACVMQSFSISKARFFSIRDSYPCVNPLALEAHVSCGKRGGALV